MYFDDYYENYSEFDTQVEEFKNSLKECVKEEIKTELESLRKENQELKEVKKNWESIQKDYDEKLRTFENEKEEIKRNLKREMYQDSLKEFFEKLLEYQDLYEVDYESLKKPKCNLCDEYRVITLYDNLGREYKTSCDCDKSHKNYYTKKSDTSLYVQKAKNKNNFYIALNTGKGYDCCSIFGFRNGELKFDKNVLNKFDINNPPESCYGSYFLSEEEAQKYCDYLNDLEANKWQKKS